MKKLQRIIFMIPALLLSPLIVLMFIVDPKFREEMIGIGIMLREANK